MALQPIIPCNNTKALVKKINFKHIFSSLHFCCKRSGSIVKLCWEVDVFALRYISTSLFPQINLCLFSAFRVFFLTEGCNVQSVQNTEVISSVISLVFFFSC